MVPRIYDLMVRKAAEADLFGQTYQEERVAYHQFWLGVDTNSGGNV